MASGDEPVVRHIHAQLNPIGSFIRIRTNPPTPNASVQVIPLVIPSFEQPIKRTGFDGLTDEYYLPIGTKYAIIVDGTTNLGSIVLDVPFDIFGFAGQHLETTIDLQQKAGIDSVKAGLVLTAINDFGANLLAQINNGLSTILSTITFGLVQLNRLEARGNQLTIELQEKIQSPIAIGGAIAAIIALSLIAAIVIVGVSYLWQITPKSFKPATNPNTGMPCQPGECGCPPNFVMDTNGNCVPIGGGPSEILDKIQKIIIIGAVAAAAIGVIAIIKSK